MSTKKVQTRVLENWIGVDKIIFGKNDPKKVLDEKTFKRFTTAKASLLSNLYEIYLKVGFDPKKTFTNVSEMETYATQLSALSMKRAEKIIKEQSVMKEIMDEVKTVGINEGVEAKDVAKYVIGKRYKAIALDCLMLESALKNACSACVSDWKGKVLIDAHKTLRDKLLDTVM